MYDHNIVRFLGPEEILNNAIKAMEQHLKDKGIKYECPLCKDKEYTFFFSEALGATFIICKNCKYRMSFDIEDGND